MRRSRPAWSRRLPSLIRSLLGMPVAGAGRWVLSRSCPGGRARTDLKTIRRPPARTRPGQHPASAVEVGKFKKMSPDARLCALQGFYLAKKLTAAGCHAKLMQGPGGSSPWRVQGGARRVKGRALARQRSMIFLARSATSRKRAGSSSASSTWPRMSRNS